MTLPFTFTLLENNLEMSGEFRRDLGNEKIGEFLWSGIYDCGTLAICW